MLRTTRIDQMRRFQPNPFPRAADQFQIERLGLPHRLPANPHRPTTAFAPLPSNLATFSSISSEKNAGTRQNPGVMPPSQKGVDRHAKFLPFQVPERHV